MKVSLEIRRMMIKHQARAHYNYHIGKSINKSLTTHQELIDVKNAHNLQPAFPHLERFPCPCAQGVIRTSQIFGNNFVH